MTSSRDERDVDAGHPRQRHRAGDAGVDLKQRRRAVRRLLELREPGPSQGEAFGDPPYVLLDLRVVQASGADGDAAGNLRPQPHMGEEKLAAEAAHAVDRVFRSGQQFVHQEPAAARKRELLLRLDEKAAAAAASDVRLDKGRQRPVAVVDARDRNMPREERVSAALREHEGGGFGRTHDEAGRGAGPAGELGDEGVHGWKHEVDRMLPQQRLEARAESGLAERGTGEVAVQKDSRGIVRRGDAAAAEHLDLVALQKRLDDLEPRLVHGREDEDADCHGRPSSGWRFTVSRTK
jgi:hypothetical protein